MSITPLWVRCLDVAAGATNLALSWLVYSALVIGLGLLAGRCLRSRGSALQSAIYRTTLVVAMSWPVAQWALRDAGLGLLALPSIGSLAVAEFEAVESETPLVAPPAPDAERPALEDDFALENSALRNASPDALAPASSEGIRADAGNETLFAQADAGNAQGEIAPPVAETAGAEGALAGTARATQVAEMRQVWRWRPLAGTVVATLAGLWLAGALGLLLRLRIEFARVAALRRGAVQVNEEERQLCAELARSLGVGPPALLRTPLVASPCLIGVLRPVVLLPEELPATPLSSALAHELAHAARRDCFWNLLRQLSCAVLWFQPLVWTLSRRIERSAEEVCDDYAVQFGADRLGYADLLVQLAERSWLPASYATVPLVTLRSSMGQRIGRILDQTRGLSLSVSVAAVIALVATGLITTMAGGLFVPRGPNRAPLALAETNEPEAALVASGDAKPSEKDSTALRYVGQVLDPDGKPVLGAELHLLYWRYGEPIENPAPVAMTGAEGRFEFEIDPAQMKSHATNEWLFAMLLAKAPGFGVAMAPSIDFEQSGAGVALMNPRQLDYYQRRQSGERATALRLVADEQPLRGQIVSIEGTPIAGARLMVDRMWRSKDESLDAWQKATQDAKADFYSLRSHTPDETGAPQLHNVFGQVTTDAEGRFTLPGVGRERIVELLLTGPAIETRLVKARTRAGEKIVVPHQWGTERGGIPDETYHANGFVYVAGPSQAVEGIITDAATKAPLAGVRVAAGQRGMFFGSGKPYINTVTDAAGRYRLEGLPVDQEERLHVDPPAKSDYVPVGRSVTMALNQQAQTRDFTLRKGIWARGQAIDERTGKGVRGRVHYFAAENNKHLKNYPGFSGVGVAHEARTDAEGRFEMPVLPGPGLLTFMAVDHTQLRRGAGADAITLLKSDMSGETMVFRTVPSTAMSSNEHALLQIDPAPDAEKVEVAFRLELGRDLVGRIVDERGEPLSGAIASGVDFPGAWRDQTGDTFHVEGYYTDTPRELFFYHRDRQLAGHVRIEGEPPAGLVARLAPAGSVTGRVFDDEGAPITDARIAGEGIPQDNFGDASYRLATDSEGRFTVAGLIPGRKYTILANTPNDFGPVATDITVEAGETKDLGELKIGPYVRQSGPGESAEKPKAEPKAEEKPKVADSANVSTAERVILIGRVIDAEQKPVAGAQLKLDRWQRGNSKQGLTPIGGETDAAGAFRLELSRTDYESFAGKNATQYAQLEAHAPGFGPSWIKPQELLAAKEFTLKLPPEVPLRGQVIDLEGRPVAGVTAKLMALATNEKNDLTEWLERLRSHKSDSRAPIEGRADRFLSFDEPYVTTQGDADGRFEIRGVGHGQMAVIVVSAPGMVTSQVRVMGAAIEPLVVESGTIITANESYYGSTFQYVAEPSQPIEGIVLDATSRAPIPGVKVLSDMFAGSRMSGDRRIEVVADDQGRFRIDGMPKGPGNHILAIPGDDQPYFMRTFEAPTAPDFAPVQCEVELHRGVWITGRVTDKETGRPIRGDMYYLPWPDNPAIAEMPEFQQGHLSGPQNRYPTDAEGRYRLVGLPGRGLVAMRFASTEPYPGGQGYEKIADLPSRDEFMKVVGVFAPTKVFPGAIKELRIDESGRDVQADLVIERGKTRTLHLVDTENQPVTGAEITGLLPKTQHRVVSDASPDEVVEGLWGGEKRLVLIQHAERKIGRVVRIDAASDETEPVTVVLKPLATIQGRILDSEGEPLRGANVRFNFAGESDFAHSLPNVATDDEGRFVNAEVPSGATYLIACESTKAPSKAIARQLKVDAGELIELGDVDITESKWPEPKRTMLGAKVSQAPAAVNLVSAVAATNDVAKESAELNSTTTPAARVIRGQILDAAGKPIVGAHVATIGMKAEQGGRIGGAEAIAESATDDEGRFEHQLTGVSSKTHRHAKVIARAEGLGLGWRVIHLDQDQLDVKMELAPEEIIRGRIVDIEGMPGAGVALSVRAVMNGVADSEEKGVGFFGNEATLSPAWIAPAVSDAEGRFTLHGVPAGHGVYLHTTGNERFAPQDIALNTGMPEQRGQRDGTYRALVKNVAPGVEAVLALSPAKVFEGTITYEDTGASAAGAKVKIWASQQEFGSMSSVEVVADEQGRYRLSPEPGIRFGVSAYPAEGVPYLSRETPLGDAIRWETGDRQRTVDIKLPRGTLVRGRVVEAGTKKPIAAAAIQYIPEDTKRRSIKNVVTGWQGMRYSDDEGKFEIVILPGPGRILAHGPDGVYIAQAFGSREMYNNQPGGRRNYANSVQRLEVSADQATLDLELEMQRGARVSGRIVDEQGAPVDEVIVASRLKIYPFWLSWEGQNEPVRGGKFDLGGLAPGEEYRVSFLDAKRKIGATAMLTSESGETEIVLRPCGEIAVRIVDGKGEPVADFHPTLEMVVTPGVGSYDTAAHKEGKLSADADFVANVDRTNHMDNEKTDADGRVTFGAIIPGGLYRLATFVDGESVVTKDFSVEPGQRLDVGEFVVELNK